VRDRYPDLPALLAAIRARPGMFLGRTTVRGLHLFLCGVGFAEDFHDLPAAARIGGFDADGFERWVEQRYNPRRLSLNSFVLAEHLAGSEVAGFDQWFAWYDEFAAGGAGAAGHAEPDVAADRRPNG
jgi:hypothetical protein